MCCSSTSRASSTAHSTVSPKKERSSSERTSDRRQMCKGFPFWVTLFATDCLSFYYIVSPSGSSRGSKGVYFRQRPSAYSKSGLMQDLLPVAVYGGSLPHQLARSFSHVLARLFTHLTVQYRPSILALPMDDTQQSDVTLMSKSALTDAASVPARAGHQGLQGLHRCQRQQQGFLNLYREGFHHSLLQVTQSS